jgi:hypothetical protein
MLFRSTVSQLSSNADIDTPILAAKAGLESTVAAASAKSVRFMVYFSSRYGARGAQSLRASIAKTDRLRPHVQFMRESLAPHVAF